MPKRRIPPDAFSYYFSLGLNRSYEKVASNYGVTKRAVTRFAKEDRWQERLEDAERKGREQANQKAVEALEAMNERHLQAAKLLQGRALQALREVPLEKAASVVKALDVGMRFERLIRGEPSDRTEMKVEEIIKREYERWMVPVDGEKPAESDE